MTTNNFYYSLSLLDSLYGISMTEDDFAEVGLIAWNQIGNKRCKLYRYSVCLDNCLKSIELPCNCDILEAVTTDFEDFQHVSNKHDNGEPFSAITEEYIERNKRFKNPLYLSGKFVPYERVGNTLYFHEPYHRINILYKGVQLDDEGLPKLTDKEALAIATFCAYTLKYKQGIKNNDANSFKIAEQLLRNWRMQCDLARTPEEMSLNEWNEILDAKTNWDRKIFRKSFKPLR